MPLAHGVQVVPLALGHVTPRRGPFAGKRAPIHAFLIRGLAPDRIYFSHDAVVWER